MKIKIKLLDKFLDYHFSAQNLRHIVVKINSPFVPWKIYKIRIK